MDITACPGDNCPVKESCHRFATKLDEMDQSYFVEAPGKIEAGKFTCDMYWGEASTAVWNQLKDIFRTN
jgi:hypothetical protein